MGRHHPKEHKKGVKKDKKKKKRTKTTHKASAGKGTKKTRRSSSSSSSSASSDEDRRVRDDIAAGPASAPAPRPSASPSLVAVAPSKTPPVAPQEPPRRTMAPMTKAEYEQKQSVVREELDPLTGRTRLVRGSGEIIERIVSKNQQREINRLATQSDGRVFETTNLASTVRPPHQFR